jgi:protein disulfide-isomerase A1
VSFRNGQPSDYTGGRQEPDISNWILKRVGPPSAEVTCEQLKEKIDKDRLALVYFGDKTSDDFTNNFLKVANDAKINEKFNFYHINDKECAASHGVKDTPAYVLFRKFDESPLTYNGDVEVSEIVNWATKSSVPTVIEFSEDYIEPIFGEKKDTIILFRNAEDATSDFSKAFEKAAAEFKGQLLFVNSGIKDGIQARLAEFIGVGAESVPTIRVLKPSDQMKKFAYSGDVKSLTVDSLRPFIEEFKSGKLAPFLKSEEPPTDNSAPVKVIVGKTFKELVSDSDKDVLLEVYAPWCGHCKQLEPVYNDLATELKDISNLIIAKMDGTANEVDGLEIQGFPTIKFYPSGNKGSPIEFGGERDISGFKNFLSEHSKFYKE